MQCKAIKKTLSQYIDNECQRQEKRSIENHILSCRHCQKELEQLKTMWQQLEGFESIEPNPWAFTRCQTALDQPEKTSHLRVWNRILIPVSSAAVAALGLWLGSLTWQEPPLNKPNETLIAYYEETVNEFSSSSLSSVYLQIASAENGGSNHE